jgi:hypothetical protein
MRASRIVPDGHKGYKQAFWIHAEVQESTRKLSTKKTKKNGGPANIKAIHSLWDQYINKYKSHTLIVGSVY